MYKKIEIRKFLQDYTEINLDSNEIKSLNKY